MWKQRAVENALLKINNGRHFMFYRFTPEYVFSFRLIWFSSSTLCCYSRKVRPRIPKKIHREIVFEQRRWKEHQIGMVNKIHARKSESIQQF